jgi:hypothetical protein
MLFEMRKSQGEWRDRFRDAPLAAWHEGCDRASELLLYSLLIFTPWAFGTTQDWSVRTANCIGYGLGLLLIAKWWIRRRLSWTHERLAPRQEFSPVPPVLAMLSIGLVAYVLVSALNARATYQEAQLSLEYHSYIHWLPHTYDSLSTWSAFWNYLAWLAMFWAMRDWMHGGLAYRHPVGRGLPPRLKRLLWVLSINGGLLGLEGLLQQSTGTNKLLWFKPTYYNRQAESQFGPFAYRANGAQYLNLIWPVTLGFWWALQRYRAPHARPTHHLLLASIILMIVGPIVSLSRGGALVTVGLAGLSVAVLVLGGLPGQPLRQRLRITALLLLGIVGSFAVNWNQFEGRMKELKEGYALREHLYAIGRRMAADNWLFGSGAETFQPLYQFYKLSPEEYWPGQLHNDWLETRITFGWVGFGLIVTALGTALSAWFVPGNGFRMSWRMASFLWIAIIGCLIHARWDFPFQVYSVALVFLFYCAILSCSQRVAPAHGTSPPELP